MLHQVIKKPLVSEKNSALTELQNTYVFRVDLDADKLQIRNAIEKAFNVKVLSVRTSVARGKYFRKAMRFGPPKIWKKAFVKLKAGEKISLFEGA